jgi:hypothetical protein
VARLHPLPKGVGWGGGLRARVAHSLLLARGWVGGGSPPDKDLQASLRAACRQPTCGARPACGPVACKPGGYTLQTHELGGAHEHVGVAMEGVLHLQF